MSANFRVGREYLFAPDNLVAKWGMNNSISAGPRAYRAKRNEGGGKQDSRTILLFDS